MLRLIVAVALVALCAGHHSDEGQMKKYAHMKIQQACFGEEYVNKEWESMKASSKKCSTQPQMIATNDLDFQDVIDKIRNMALPWGSRPDNLVSGEEYVNKEWESMKASSKKYSTQPQMIATNNLEFQDVIDEIGPAVIPYGTQQFQIVTASGRSKRHASEEPHKHTTAEKLSHSKEKMACMIGNMTCMLLDQKCMKEDRTPDFDFYTNKIKNWDGSQEMKDELTWGLDVCKDFSMCISPTRAKSPFMKELGHYISFAKCMEMKKMQACMKTDFKKYSAKEGYDNINEIMDMGLGMGMNRQKKEKMGINALTATMSGDLIF